MDPFTGLSESELDTLVTALTLLITEPDLALEAEKVLAEDLRARVIEQLDLAL